MWVGFRSILVPAVLVEKTRQLHKGQVGSGTERNESMELGGIEGDQVGWTADHLQKSGRGGSRRGLERPWKSVGGGLHSVQQLGIQQSNEDSSDIHTVCILPIRAHLDEVKSLKKGDVYIGRGCKERLLMPSFWANRYKVARYGRLRCLALHKQEIEEDPQYERRIHELTGKRLFCHCHKNQSCHGDNLIQLYHRVYTAAYDRMVTDRAPTSAELNALAEARNECTDSEDQSLTRRLPVHHKVGVGTTVR